MDDTKVKTLRHIETVRNVINSIIGNLLERENLVNEIIIDLMKRKEMHDQSKLESPEVEIFGDFTHRLRGITYGSGEYNDCIKMMMPALIHHYKKNRHHPEHFENGIKDMTLVDLIEMICDWWAASKRHDDGDIFKSIEINQKRFKYGDELKQILINTVKYLNKQKIKHKANES